MYYLSVVSTINYVVENETTKFKINVHVMCFTDQDQKLKLRGHNSLSEEALHLHSTLYVESTVNFLYICAAVSVNTISRIEQMQMQMQI